MPPDHDNAIELGGAYAVHHAETSLAHLLRCLGIARDDPDWHGRLAPFAPVWAAMIAAAARGHATIAAGSTADSRPN